MRNTLRLLRRALPHAIALTVMVILLLWLTGAFESKVPQAEPDETRRLAEGRETVLVELKNYPRVESAVGTIRPIAETRVGSKILARVERVHVQRAGQACRRGELLVELDDSDLVARHEESKAALRAARAAAEQARIDLDRTRKLFEERLKSKEDRDRAETLVATTRADVERSEQNVAAAETALSYAKIRAPYDGLVVDKLVNEGDLVSPGQHVVAMYDPLRLQLVAAVREKLAASLEIGREIDVYIEALDDHCKGRIDEIVPEAERGSRSFEVKVSGPCSPRVMTGMFGRMTFEIGDQPELRIPTSSVRRVGQLSLVFVVDGENRVLRHFVRLGRTHGSHVQVVSGLSGGERILLDAQSRG